MFLFRSFRSVWHNRELNRCVAFDSHILFLYSKAVCSSKNKSFSVLNANIILGFIFNEIKILKREFSHMLSCQLEVTFSISIYRSHNRYENTKNNCEFVQLHFELCLLFNYIVIISTNELVNKIIECRADFDIDSIIHTHFLLSSILRNTKYAILLILSKVFKDIVHRECTIRVQYTLYVCA